MSTSIFYPVPGKLLSNKGLSSSIYGVYHDLQRCAFWGGYRGVYFGKVTEVYISERYIFWRGYGGVYFGEVTEVYILENLQRCLF